MIANHGHTNPTGVLTDLKRHRTQLGFTFKDFEQAIVRSGRSQPRVNVAWSNPCFELWYILHFDYYNTPLDRKMAEQKLNDILNRTFCKSYDKTDSNNPELLNSRMERALENAAMLEEKGPAKDHQPVKSNPATAVHHLVALLQGLS